MDGKPKVLQSHKVRPALKKHRVSLRMIKPGGVAERPIAPVLKTGEGNTSEGSNPSPSAPINSGVFVISSLSDRPDVNTQCSSCLATR